MEVSVMLVRYERHPLIRPPYSDVAGLESEIDQLLGSFLSDSWHPGGSAVPALDVTEREHELEVFAELPGVSKEDLKVLVHDGVLTISGERSRVGLPEQARWIRNETTGGSFSRSLELPVPVKDEAITAELKDGVLRVVLPKVDDPRPKEIRVK
jgi:HSP20 family protein